MSESLPSPFLQNLLESVVEEQGVSDPKFAVQFASSAGENYLGVLYRVTVTGATVDRKQVEWSVIVKCMPSSKEKREDVGSAAFFRNEVQYYQEIVPEFLSFQEEKKIPVEKRFAGFAKYYFAFSDGENDALILEDMKAKGFQMRDRHEGLDAEHCFLVLRELGKYHALSFALRSQKSEIFDRLKGAVMETLRNSDGFRGYIEHCKVLALEAVRKRTGEGSVYHERLEQFCDQYLETLRWLLEGEAAQPYSVICHGDSWTNNFLFKYSKDGVTPESVCFLDFQISRYNSPIYDIAHLIYISTTQRTRNENFDAMMLEYYNSLSNFLRLLGSDPEEIFPHDIFKEQLQKFFKFGVVVALFDSVMVFSVGEALDLHDLANLDKGNKQIKSNNLYEERITDVIIDAVDRGFI